MKKGARCDRFEIAKPQTPQQRPPMSAAYTTSDLNAPSDVFATARQHFDAIINSLECDPTTYALDSDDLEEHIYREGRELMRKLLQAHYDMRAPARPVFDVVDEEGIGRTFSRANTGRNNNSRFGTVRISRVAFCCAQAAQLCPLDADLNLAPTKLSRQMLKLVCEHAREVSFETTQEQICALTGLNIGNRQLEEAVVYVTQDFDAFYEQRQAQTSEDASNHLILTTDAKGVSMIERDLREQTREKAQNARVTSKEKRHLGPGEKRDRKRMATVASVYEHVPNPRTASQIMSKEKVRTRRETIEHKRVWADLEKSSREVIDLAFEEALRRDPQGQRQWAVLVDGDTRQMKAVIDKVEEVASQGISVLVVVDLIHVAEYLWVSANALFGVTSTERQGWVSEQLLRLLQGEAKRVVHGMRVSAGKRKLSKSQREAVEKSARYIEARYDYLRYDEAIEEGLPIATGVIEGACRHLVNDRLGITGAKWSLETAQAILRLRALKVSGDWETYWQWHKQRRHEREHASKYADETPPELIYPTLRNHLELVR